MGRRSYYDTDEERLPEGMTRIGYDADSQIYTYRDSDGSLWEGAPGAKYGKLHPVQGRAAPPLPSVQIPDDVAGDEQPYVLYDKDEDEDDWDKDSGYQQFQDGADEKEGILVAEPEKAKLHGSGDLEKWQDHDHHYDPFAQRQPAPLKRAGTLSRLARFILPSSSSTESSTAQRRATVSNSDKPVRAASSGATPTRSRRRATTFDEILGVPPARK